MSCERVKKKEITLLILPVSESSYTSAEQYALCKEVGMHPGIMCLVTIKHMAGVLKKQGYVWEEEETKRLCAEAKEHALVAYGKESSIMPYLERIEEAKQGRLTVTQVVPDLI